ncbi:translation initiation factor [Alkalimonas collagenimarina]|uniref:Translation initiation factor n=1 Tax=Alkalimonas collagenimarina TaxID=400390 RepID=A0ABT9GV62_9GAMM|nr:translation initiation factor [Alkalimonas collagenimarina]MDP4534863.1 translation initiation factor [Alkalimonas collagenimarina]
MSRKSISLADWQQQLNPASAPSSISAPSDQDLVYRTDGGTVMPAKASKASGQAFADGKVLLQRESKGRGGKRVITIRGIAEPHEQLTKLCQQLKKTCACGGTVKEGVIEIQSEQREKLEQALQRLGFTTKWSGG